MRRLTLPLMLAAAASGCVSVEALPDARGALKPGQRLVVAVYPSPGPWIIDAADTKAEIAAKLSPVGFLMQTVQNEHVLSVSKDLQQYLPRPHLAAAVQDALVDGLRNALSTSTVQTAPGAGIAPAQLVEWNKAKDQLDWRLRYYAPDPGSPAPRDYARALILDDALILDVNVSFGTQASEEGQLMPAMSASSRVYRGDTARLIWEHEDEMTDRTSSTTLSEFKIQPRDLTDRLVKLAPGLGKAVAASFVKAFGIAGSVAAPPAGAAPGGGLVPQSLFNNPPPTPPPAIAPSTGTISIGPPAAAVVVSSGPPPGYWGAAASTTSAPTSR